MLERWARPWARLWNGTAGVMDAIYRRLGRPGKLLQDLLNGSRLGHSLHPVVVDVVVGGWTVLVLLQVLTWLGVGDLRVAILWVLGLTWLTGLSAIATGLTDFKDTATGDERHVVGLHGLINIAATAVLFGAFVALLGEADAIAGWLIVAGFAVLSVGAFIGGHVVFKYGYMVNHNAFAGGKKAKEYTPILPAADLAEATPTKAMLGPTALVVVRRGDLVFALKETCSHAGGPLSQGTLAADTIVCPWHASAFRISDGAVRHGPAATRQVAYRARISGDQVEVQGPIV
ncbi:MAG TPA: Rieske (2Fe-2S) protein [Candidatus Limnocylindrales bacterium]|nr:Rieske (2Fe-2S) protein [Candidatus Limnocylindrales bacterium]